MKTTNLFLLSRVSFGTLFHLCVAFNLSNIGQLVSQTQNFAWPTFQHDIQHTGRSEFTVPNNLTRKWATYVGGRQGKIEYPPSVSADGTVYQTIWEGNSVVAIKPDGTIKWSFTAGGSIYSPPTIGADGYPFGEPHLEAEGRMSYLGEGFFQFCGKSSAMRRCG